MHVDDLIANDVVPSFHRYVITNMIYISITLDIYLVTTNLLLTLVV